MGIGHSEIIEQMVSTSGCHSNFIHHLLHYGGECRIAAVDSFGILEIDVGILCRTAQGGVFGIEGFCAEFVDFLPVD